MGANRDDCLLVASWGVARVARRGQVPEEGRGSGPSAGLGVRHKQGARGVRHINNKESGRFPQIKAFWDGQSKDIRSGERWPWRGCWDPDICGPHAPR